MTTKNTTQHTPGPWTANGHCESDDYTPAHCWIKSGPKQIAAAFYGKTDAERLANATLISAAPELLEALRRAASIIEDLPYPENYAAKTFREIIAKATGEGK